MYFYWQLLFMNINYHYLYILPYIFMNYLFIYEFIIIDLYKIYSKILIYCSNQISFTLIAHRNYRFMIYWNRIHFATIIKVKNINIIVPRTYLNIIYFTATYYGSLRISIDDNAKSQILKLFFKLYDSKFINLRNPSALIVKIFFFSLI